ncbi:MAG: hypothetical protein PHS80_01700 [Methanothrix sp.]|nr:hypothetical protein [Methanothrix sp.]MDD4446220.1 hypothetical protein [Methanothrix sp.]
MTELIEAKDWGPKEIVELDIDPESAVRREYSEFSMKSLLNYGD